MESESPCETDAVVEMTTALRSLRSIHDEIAKVNDTCEANGIPDLLARYEEEVARVWDSLSVMHFHGREHLLREVLLGLERFQQPKFRAICSGWIGTPGVEERCASIENHWSHIQYVLLQPSKEVAVRQLVQYALPKSDQIAMAMGGTQPLRNSCVYVPQQRGGCFPPGEGFSGLVNLNVAQSGADASATLKSSQELQCELKLAQTMEIANSQEQRFKTLLKDLNSSAAELVNKIEQSQAAQQEMLDISANSKQTFTELKAQNEAAQQITNQIQRDRGLSRCLLTACAAVALCLGLPKLSFLLPALKRIPALQPHAKSLEKAIKRGNNSSVVANLIRERYMYKLSYETLQEVADIQHSGNFLHKIAFGILGLGRIIKNRMEGLAPPSDRLDECERWIDQRLTPYGPPQWAKTSHN